MILFAQTGLPGTCSKANSYVKKKKKKKNKYLVSDLYQFFACEKFIHSFLLLSGVGQGSEMQLFLLWNFFFVPKHLNLTLT